MSQIDQSAKAVMSFEIHGQKFDFITPIPCSYAMAYLATASLQDHFLRLMQEHTESQKPQVDAIKEAVKKDKEDCEEKSEQAIQE